MTFRQTVDQPTRFLAGIGLHSGLPSSVRILPSANHGILFRDRTTGQEITAVCENVFDTRRCTMLSANGAKVQTVEHVLSALAGLRISDAVIEFEGIELPALDGSAFPYVEVIREAGIRTTSETVTPLVVAAPVTVAIGQSVVVAFASEQPSISVILEYADLPDMTGLSATWREQDYGSFIAPARTFGFVSELDMLLANGLAQGASADNVIALTENGEVDPRTPLRFANELARHKLLDLIGDLSLFGRPFAGSIVAFRPSHTLNVRLAAELARLANS